jgi:hypothetical protein
LPCVACAQLQSRAEEEDTVLKRIITALALVAALLVPSAAVAAPKFAGLTYTTTTTFPDGTGTPTTATVAGLHFERNQFGEICAVYDLTVHGSFQYWTGSEFVTMTQQPVPQRQVDCQAADVVRYDLTNYDLNCQAGTFDTWRYTGVAPDVRFASADGGTLIGGLFMAPLVLTATTDAQREAICDLQARASRLSDKRLVAELNKLLALFAAT